MFQEGLKIKYQNSSQSVRVMITTHERIFLSKAAGNRARNASTPCMTLVASALFFIRERKRPVLKLDRLSRRPLGVVSLVHQSTVVPVGGARGRL